MVVSYVMTYLYDILVASTNYRAGFCYRRKTRLVILRLMWFVLQCYKDFSRLRLLKMSAGFLVFKASNPNPSQEVNNV